MQRLNLIHVAALGALLGAAGCDGTSRSPDVSFQSTFSQEPGPAIHSLQGECYAFRDSGYAYLTFQTTSAELHRLIGNNFHTVSANQFRLDANSTMTIGSSIPAWWNPIGGSSVHYLESHTLHPTFGGGEALLAFDPGTGIVYLYWDGVD